MGKYAISSPVRSINNIANANYGHFEIALTTMITQCSTTTMS
jgi:hypothetical protein